MSRRLFTGGLVWLMPTLIVLSRAAAAADACVILEAASGDTALAASIAYLLEQHGVHTGIERCGTDGVRVLIGESSDQTSVAVTIRDPEGKNVRRRIPRDDKAAAVVASLVESFVLGVDTDLLLRPNGPSSEENPGAVPALRRTGQVGLVGGFLFGSDASTWYGAALDGCLRAAWSCVGLRTRLAEDDQGGGISSDLVRTQWGGSIYLGVPLEGERWQLVPAFAVGVTYTRSSQFPAPFRISVTDYDMHGQLSLGVAWFLSTSWAVRLDVAGELATALSHASRQPGPRLDALLSSLVPDPPAQSAWLGIGLECRR
jgi:hypothetical protein